MNNSKIFKDAHKYRKSHGVTMSVALKYTYRRIKFNSYVRNIAINKGIDFNVAYRSIYSEFPGIETAANILKVRMIDVLFLTNQIDKAIKIASVA